MTRTHWILGAIVTVGAALRFLTLDVQSFWFDEAATVDLLKPSLQETMNSVTGSGETPPFYYSLTWLWTRVFGEGEVGLRSFSALAGTATLPFVFLAGRRLVHERAGLVAAGLIAVNPMMLWYSQEARSYALMVLVSAIGLWLFARLLREPPTRRRILAWSLVGCLAAATHYFAVFVVAAEALWLWRRGVLRARRDVLAGLGPLALTGLFLIPMAQRQGAQGRANWISGQPIGDRVGDVLRELMTWNTGIVSSSSGLPQPGFDVLALIAVGLAVWAAWRRTTPEARSGAGVAAGVGLVALAVPWLLSGNDRLDFFKDRNLMAAWLPLAVALAAGLTAARLRPRVAIGALAVLVVACLATDVRMFTRADMQRHDWRTELARLGPTDPERAVVIKPDYAGALFRAYGRAASPYVAGAPIRELVIIGNEATADEKPPPGLEAFELVERHSNANLWVLRFRAPEPVRLDAGAVAAIGHPLRLDTAPGRPAPLPPADDLGYRVPFGAAIANEPLTGDDAYATAFARAFSVLAVENASSWGVVQPREGDFDFSRMDALVAHAERSGKRVRAGLVWDHVLPGWLTERDWEPEELREVLDDHIRALVTHYRGRVDEWVVVNEPLTDETGELERSLWLRVLGEAYIADAFRTAREADPDATLLLNEIAAERGDKFDGLLRLARSLEEDGVPLDGVGLQNHTTAGDYPTRAELARDMRRIARAGLDTQITEMDVVVEPGDDLRRQADAYRAAARACVQAERCTGFTVWGVTDTHSWKGAESRALLFDADGNAKPAFDAVVAELSRPAGP